MSVMFNSGPMAGSYTRPMQQTPQLNPRQQMAAYAPNAQQAAQRQPAYTRYTQGKAQSIQPTSQGTPYQAYNPPTSQPAYTGNSPQSPYGQKQGWGDVLPVSGWGGNSPPAFGQGWSNPPPYSPTMRPPSQQVTGDPLGGYAGSPANRPPPLQMAPAQTPWGDSMDPFADQQAFINQLNQQRAQRAVAYNQSGNSFNNPVNPNLDFRAAMNNAGLGGGSPSMSPNYGNSFIGSFNQQYARPQRFAA